MYLPLLFKDKLLCLFVGGGQVASRKIKILLETHCDITIVAPHLSGLAAKEAAKGSVRWLKREYARGDCKGFQLVIAATPVREVNRQVSEEARERGIPINVVDDPALSTVIFPALWRDRSLLLAVSTEGIAPFMAAEIRTFLAKRAQGMGRWVEIAGRFREIVRKDVKDAGERKRLYKRFLDAGQLKEIDAPPIDASLGDWLSWLDGIRKPRC
jgi:uroporphyrin-III C-methyltransferase / precorrin-2 dehydrogenase / sirohydrochlorin ferrochelatase